MGVFMNKYLFIILLIFSYFQLKCTRYIFPDTKEPIVFYTTFTISYFPIKCISSDYKKFEPRKLAQLSEAEFEQPSRVILEKGEKPRESFDYRLFLSASELDFKIRDRIDKVLVVKDESTSGSGLKAEVMTKEKFDKEYKAESDITIDLTKEEKKS
jgi:hypothetical protein